MALSFHGSFAGTEAFVIVVVLNKMTVWIVVVAVAEHRQLAHRYVYNVSVGSNCWDDDVGRAVVDHAIFVHYIWHVDWPGHSAVDANSFQQISEDSKLLRSMVAVAVLMLRSALGHGPIVIVRISAVWSTLVCDHLYRRPRRLPLLPVLPCISVWMYSWKWWLDSSSTIRLNVGFVPNSKKKTIEHLN